MIHMKARRISSCGERFSTCVTKGLASWHGSKEGNLVARNRWMEGAWKEMLWVKRIEWSAKQFWLVKDRRHYIAKVRYGNCTPVYVNISINIMNMSIIITFTGMILSLFDFCSFRWTLLSLYIAGNLLRSSGCTNSRWSRQPLTKHLKFSTIFHKAPSFPRTIPGRSVPK